jgi:hypothetical protein
MASYHTSFDYKEKNSLDEGYMVVAFEPDDGFTDSFLSMENISDDYYDGTKRFDYGSKYNSSPEIKITIIKKDGTSMTLNDFRSCAKWLTGARINSWLDMYDGDTIVYSFLGKFLNLEQYKLDARTIGCRLTFSSVSPWAYSAEQYFDYSIEQVLFINANGSLDKDTSDSLLLSTDANGTLYNDSTYMNNYFSVEQNGTAYIDTTVMIQTDNQTDDLYTYINLDVDYVNQNSDSVSIKNITLNEETLISGLGAHEIVALSAKQFIVSYNLDSNGNRIKNEHKIFGDDFNFVWPRLAPGINQFVVTAHGDGKIKFSYRYPMKVGDCTMDIRTYGSEIYCGDCSDVPSYNTVKWDDIIDTPTTIGGYGITDAYTIVEVDDKIDNIEITGGTGGSTNVDEQELNDMLADILG